MSATGTGTREPTDVATAADHPVDAESARRRFTIAASIGFALSSVPYLWVLWDGSFDPLRAASAFRAFSNFYELQARALAHGHWWVPKGSLGVEAFIRDGRDYMYFGPFPSVLRAPFLAVTDDLDGRMSAPSMLLAWMLTGLLCALLLWRVRMLLRGPVPLGRSEAVGVAALVATITGGSVLVFLAATPWVWSEDFTWGVALSIGSAFSLLGVLEQPSRGRVVATGAFTLAAVLTRAPLGWGCALAALLAAVWVWTGRGGVTARRWSLPLSAAGLVPLGAWFAVNWMKFGFRLFPPNTWQAFTKVNEHRREVLAANGGKLWSLDYLPTTLVTYFRPDGLGLSPVFPFITLPSEPARAVGDVVLDQSYRTASLTASMPLLVVLGVWGAVVAFRRHPVGRVALVRFSLVGLAAATTGVLIWSYIGNRYVAEFLPLIVVAAAVGFVELWRRLDGRSRRTRKLAVAAVATLGLFGIIANVAVAITPTDLLTWPPARVSRYVETQLSISDLTGHPLDDRIAQGPALPDDDVRPDRLFVLGDCDALYLSTGNPDNPWIAAEIASRTFRVTFHEPLDRGARVPLLTADVRPTINTSLEGDGMGRVRLRADAGSLHQATDWVPVRVGKPYLVRLLADTEYFPLNFRAALTQAERIVIEWTFDVHKVKPPRSVPVVNAASDAFTVTALEKPELPLCRRLVRAVESRARGHGTK